MRILLTGAAGDFGRDLAPWLARHHEVTLTDMRPTETSLEFRQADLSDPGQVAGLCEGVDAVIHLAALLPKADYGAAQYLQANAQAVGVLAEEAVRAGVGRFIYVSTVWTTGHGAEEGSFRLDEQAPTRPVCMYGITKLLGENLVEYYARTRGLDSVILRACGYQRHPDFAADGEIDWELADLASVAACFTTPAAKLFHPADLGPLFAAALDLPHGELRRILVGLTVPFSEADAAGCCEDPIAAWESYYPGAADFFASCGHRPPPFTHAYDNSLSQRLLGFRMRYDLGDAIAAWRRREGGR